MPRRVTRILDQLVEIHGKAVAIRCDSGPELTSCEFTHWCATRNNDVRFIQAYYAVRGKIMCGAFALESPLTYDYACPEWCLHLLCS